MTGARRPITRAVQTTRSFFAIGRGHQLGLLLAERIAHLAGIGAGLPRGLLILHADEAAAERLDLLLGSGTHVGGGHNGAEPAGRRDRLQPGDAGSDHEQPGRRNSARGSHHHRKATLERPRCFNNSAVAGEVRLARQHIHRLRTGDARQQLHGGTIDASACQFGHRVSFGKGVGDADQQGAARDQVTLFGQRHLHREDDLRAGQRLGRIRCRSLPRRRQTPRPAARHCAPAPASTATVRPRPIRRFTVSGVAATRVSDARCSFSTARRIRSLLHNRAQRGEPDAQRTARTGPHRPRGKMRQGCGWCKGARARRCIAARIRGKDEQHVNPLTDERPWRPAAHPPQIGSAVLLLVTPARLHRTATRAVPLESGTVPYPLTGPSNRSPRFNGGSMSTSVPPATKHTHMPAFWNHFGSP